MLSSARSANYLDYPLCPTCQKTTLLLKLWGLLRKAKIAAQHLCWYLALNGDLSRDIEFEQLLSWNNQSNLANVWCWKSVKSTLQIQGQTKLKLKSFF